MSEGQMKAETSEEKVNAVVARCGWDDVWAVLLNFANDRHPIPEGQAVDDAVMGVERGFYDKNGRQADDQP